MATSLLTGNGAARLSARTLTLVLDLEQSGVQADFDLPPGLPAIRPRPGMVVIDEVPSSLTVALVPRTGGSFPSPAVAHLTISTPPEIAGFEGDRIIVPSIDIAGSGRRELVIITPQDGFYRFQRLDPEDATDLSPLAESVRVNARQLIGADRVPRPVPLRVVVDTSASMLPLIRGRAVQDAVEVLAGVATVLTSDNRMSLTVGATTVPSMAQDSAPAVEAALESARPTSSFSAADASAAPGSVIYVVTDGVPFDVERLEADAATRYHLVLVCSAPAAALMQGSTSLPVTSVDMPAQARVLDELLGDPAKRGLVVRSLLRDFLLLGVH